MKTVISFKKKECNVRYYKNDLLFTFKGSKYAMNILVLSIFLQLFGNIKKTEWLFPQTEYL